MSEIIVCHEEAPSNILYLKKSISMLDKIMVPPISSIIDFDSYINKIAHNADVFYAFDKKHLCGCCVVYLNRDKGFISSIGVFYNYTRKGVGTLLLNEVFKIAKEKNIFEIELMVHKNNMKAMEFYLKSGFLVESYEDEWIKMKSITIKN